MMVDAVMDTYLEMGFITKCQYNDFDIMKQEMIKANLDENLICRKFFEYLDILPMECEMVDMLMESFMRSRKKEYGTSEKKENYNIIRRMNCADYLDYIEI